MPEGQEQSSGWWGVVVALVDALAEIGRGIAQGAAEGANAGLAQAAEESAGGRKMQTTEEYMESVQSGKDRRY
eukprot:g14387.t1